VSDDMEAQKDKIYTRAALAKMTCKELKEFCSRAGYGTKQNMIDKAFRYHVHDAAIRGDTTYLKQFFGHPGHTELVKEANKHFCGLHNCAIRRGKLEVVELLKELGHPSLQPVLVPDGEVYDNCSSVCEAIFSEEYASLEETKELITFLVETCKHGIGPSNFVYRIQEIKAGNQRRYELVKHLVELKVIGGEDYAKTIDQTYEGEIPEQMKELRELILNTTKREDLIRD